MGDGWRPALRRGGVTGGLVFITLLAAFAVTGELEWWIVVAACGGAYLVGRRM